jgi:hypothetical protein
MRCYQLPIALIDEGNCVQRHPNMAYAFPVYKKVGFTVVKGLMICSK